MAKIVKDKPKFTPDTAPYVDLFSGERIDDRIYVLRHRTKPLYAADLIGSDGVTRTTVHLSKAMRFDLDSGSEHMDLLERLCGGGSPVYEAVDSEYESIFLDDERNAECDCESYIPKAEYDRLTPKQRRARVDAFAVPRIRQTYKELGLELPAEYVEE